MSSGSKNRPLSTASTSSTSSAGSASAAAPGANSSAAGRRYFASVLPSSAAAAASNGGANFAQAVAVMNECQLSFQPAGALSNGGQMAVVAQGSENDSMEVSQQTSLA